MFRVLLIAALLAGCSQAAERDARADRRKARSEAAETAKEKPVESRAYEVKGHELLVVDVPTGGSPTFVERQKCFVWRDREFKTASLQCPSDAGDVSFGGPENEPHP